MWRRVAECRALPSTRSGNQTALRHLAWFSKGAATRTALHTWGNTALHVCLQRVEQQDLRQCSWQAVARGTSWRKKMRIPCRSRFAGKGRRRAAAVPAVLPKWRHEQHGLSPGPARESWTAQLRLAARCPSVTLQPERATPPLGCQPSVQSRSPSRNPQRRRRMRRSPLQPRCRRQPRRWRNCRSESERRGHL
jgi:hypothetical protein